MSADSRSICAQSILALMIFAVVIWAVAIMAIEVYSSSAVMLPAASSLIFAVTAVRAFTFSTSMSASAIWAREMLAS